MADHLFSNFHVVGQSTTWGEQKSDRKRYTWSDKGAKTALKAYKPTINYPLQEEHHLATESTDKCRKTPTSGAKGCWVHTYKHLLSPYSTDQRGKKRYAKRIQTRVRTSCNLKTGRNQHEK